MGNWEQQGYAGTQEQIANTFGRQSVSENKAAPHGPLAFVSLRIWGLCELTRMYRAKRVFVRWVGGGRR